MNLDLDIQQCGSITQDNNCCGGSSSSVRMGHSSVAICEAPKQMEGMEEVKGLFNDLFCDKKIKQL